MPIEHRVIATPDPPPTGVPNPIHDEEGGKGAGYDGALVAGVRSYGWAVAPILEAAGDRWLDDGWIDFSLRRPLFAGEELVMSVAADGDEWTLECVAAGERVVLDGRLGLGDAAWLDDLDPPSPGLGVDPPATRPGYTLDTAPVGDTLLPLTVHLSQGAGARLATDDLGIDDTRYTTDGRIQPMFLAGRMSPITRHNYTYGPTIHVRSQIQHRGAAIVAAGGTDVTVGARLREVYDRKEHWYQVLDGVVTTGVDALGPELARIRHHTIFRPRGTG